MTTVHVPYGESAIDCAVDDTRVLGIVAPAHQPEVDAGEQANIVQAALASPIGAPRLRDLARGKRRVLLITSDHTRPMPSGITLPLLLAEIRAGAPNADIHILVATGFHRAMTRDEMRARFGGDIVERETVLVHDARDHSQMTYFGIMPSGGELWLNREVEWADLILSEGFIEPHFFAGYSGGRKSVLPGVASEKTVFFNHNAEFIAHDCARNGVLADNPIHRDMAFAAERTGLAFILNVCLNEHKQIVRAYAGDAFSAHAKGCAFVAEQTTVKRREADIVITGNGGYPLDLNIYQAVKCMSGAEPFVRRGGVIIALCSCVDGHGSEGFHELFVQHKTPEGVERAILARGRDGTLPDQWQAQILARVMQKATVILLSRDCDPALIASFGLHHAQDFEQAMRIADGIAGEDASVLFIPNGVEIIPT
jgi:nickel-dependent lactate racemase